MAADILSGEADALFSERVVSYNRRKSGERKKEEEAFIRERTKMLVYRICRDQLFVNEDSLSLLFLNIHDDLEKIIGSYRITTRSYNIYLKQVCIYRMRRIMKDEQSRRNLEQEYIRETDELYTTDDSFLLGDESEEYSILPSRPDFYALMDMPSLISHIVTTRNRSDYRTHTVKENALRKKLENRYFRRNFLFYLLAKTEQGEDALTQDYARVFQTDETAFLRLFSLKNEIISRNCPERQKNLDIAAKHWRIMARLRNSMYRAQSREEYSVLKENYIAHSRCHRNRLSDAGRSMRGLGHSEIAEVFNISRTAVTMAISSCRKELEVISSMFSV